MAPAVLRDDEALQRTTQLINFLARVTDAVNRNPRQDICAGSADSRLPLVWIDDIPDGVGVRLDADGDEPLFAIRPVPLVASPALPVDLHNRVDAETINDLDREPGLAPLDVDDVAAAPDAERVRALYDHWLDDWRSWAAEERPRRLRRELYDQMESAAKAMEQRDDEFECVIAAGLVCWKAGDGTVIRRHLLTEPVRPVIDRRTAEVRVTRVGGRRRMEDAEVFHQQPCYLPERGRGHRDALLASELPVDSPEVQESLREWLGLSMSVAVDAATSRTPDGTPLPPVPQMSPSPAFVMRPRSQVLVAEAYRRIAAELDDPDAAVPVGLAQLVVDTEPAQRDAWLAGQGAVSGDLLGEDPLFPLKANGEQQRVMDLLRTETGVVVQGPPGTGKTHTIANLVSALLARGQRVLVTSQKDQALKVLRDKIPSELRHLCVLLAGGSRGAAAELQRGLDAFSAAQAGADRGQLLADARRLATERDNLRGRSATVNREIAQLREVENLLHGAVVPGFSTELYRGPLTQIVRDVRRGSATHGWMPSVPVGASDLPPLDHAQLLELVEHLRLPEGTLDARAGQVIPGPDQLPPAGFLAERLAERGHAMATVERDGTALSRQLAALGGPELDHLDMLCQQVTREMVACGLSTAGAPVRAPQWVVRAVADRFAGRHAGLWGHLLEVRDDARQLQQRLQGQGVRFVVEIPQIDPANLGVAKGWLNAGNTLLDHVRGGGKLRNLVQKKVQREAQPMLQAVRVDGDAPGTADQLAAALDHLDAAVAAVQLAQKWADSQVPITGGPLPALLSELADNAAYLGQVQRLAAVHRAVVEHLARCGVSIDVSSSAVLVDVIAAVPAARQQHALQQAEQRLAELQRHVRDLAASPGACPELAGVLSAVMAGDPQAYAAAAAAVAVARREQAAHRRLHELLAPLGSAHPELAALVRSTAHDAVWPSRTAATAQAWAWSKAQQFVQQQRNADRERELFCEFEQLDHQLDLVTKRLVHARSMLALLDRMSDSHARALNSYREHMSKIGAGTGRKTGEFRKAARAAMRKAQGAVPAWVVPLPTLLENLEPGQDSFDVVIVDEASQVGIEHLYLLWMAPRVIVVGDDKQCTPGPSRLGELDWLFNQNDALMPDIEHDIRRLFTQKSNLYGVLSARSGRDALIRLREHFRCMPEIINWSSQMFYPDNSGKPGLVPLRERRANDLEPLKVVQVEDATTEGRDQRRRNPREAKAIVEELTACIDDPRYDGKSFGVVVLHSQGQIKVLEHEINAAVSIEEREKRQIRVGSPVDFQGDERDVIFLSMVVAERPQAATADIFRQSYNVAASRAKDQMWLFVSVPPDELKSEDLRASLLGYMLEPPSILGESPSLDQVPADRACEPFDSLFEQRVFRELKERGYHVVPQYPVGSRRLDLVVAGDGGRIAVECDGHRWHAGTDGQINDARRDQELARQGWQTVRLRESEFEFDRARELRRLWDLLDARGILPVDPPVPARNGASE